MMAMALSARYAILRQGRRFKRFCQYGAVITVVLALGSCNSSEQTTADTQLVDIKKQLHDLNAQYQDLGQRCDAMADQMTMLQAENEQVKLKAVELAQWSRQLADSFGPGVWYFSDAERPLPVKTMADATPEMVIAELNRLFVRDKLPLVTLEHVGDKTASVTISPEEQLTQHMGTTGATAYIEVVTYSLTSLAAVDSVEFHFQEGDHAIPGRYSR